MATEITLHEADSAITTPMLKFVTKKNRDALATSIIQ